MGTLRISALTSPKISTSIHDKGLFGPENLRVTGVANRLDVERDTTKSRKIGPFDDFILNILLKFDLIHNLVSYFHHQG